MDEPVPRRHHARAQARGARRVSGGRAAPGGPADRVVRPGEDPGEHRGAVRAVSRDSRKPAAIRPSGSSSGPSIASSGTTRSPSPPCRRGRFGTRCSGWRATSSSPARRSCSVAERGDECRVQFRWLLAQETEPPVLVDVCFAWVVGIARRGTGGLVNPKRLELRASDGQPRDVRGALRLPGEVRRAARTRIVFGKADLDRPFLTHNADLVRDGRAAARGRAVAGARFEERSASRSRAS